MKDMFHIQVEDELFGEDWLKCFATKILDAKYERTDVVEVMKGLTHLNAHQKADLLWVLQENKKTFDETLDVYSHKKVHFGIGCILTQYLKSIWRLSKKSLTILLDLVS